MILYFKVTCGKFYFIVTKIVNIFILNNIVYINNLHFQINLSSSSLTTFWRLVRSLTLRYLAEIVINIKLIVSALRLGNGLELVFFSRIFLCDQNGAFSQKFESIHKNFFAIDFAFLHVHRYLHWSTSLEWHLDCSWDAVWFIASHYRNQLKIRTRYASQQPTICCL